MTKDSITVGQQVSYADINLRAYKGVVVAVGSTSKGGDCMVQWARYQGQFASEECSGNLIVAKNS